MCYAGRRGEGGRVGDDVCVLALESQGDFGEPEIEADERADLAQEGVEGRQDLVAGLYRLALLHLGPAVVTEIQVEEVQLLVALRDVAVGIDPYQRVFDLFEIRHARLHVAGFVDADVDGERVLARFLLQAEHERRRRDWLA